MFACNAPTLQPKLASPLGFTLPEQVESYPCKTMSLPMSLPCDPKDFFTQTSQKNFVPETSSKTPLLDYEEGCREISRLFEAHLPMNSKKDDGGIFVDESEVCSVNHFKFNVKKSFGEDLNLFEGEVKDNLGSEFSQDVQVIRETEGFNLSLCQSARGMSQDKKSFRSSLEGPLFSLSAVKIDRFKGLQGGAKEYFHCPNKFDSHSKLTRKNEAKERAKSVPMGSEHMRPRGTQRKVLLDQIPQTVKLISSNEEPKLVKNKHVLKKIEVEIKTEFIEEEKPDTQKKLKTSQVPGVKKKNKNQDMIEEKTKKNKRKIIHNKLKQNSKNINKRKSFKEHKKINTLEKKLASELKQFCKEVDKKRQIAKEDKDMLKFLMKFLFDFPIKHMEFLKLSLKAQEDIKKFIVDRFFKNEIQTKSTNFLQKRSTFSDLDSCKLDDFPTTNFKNVSESEDLKSKKTRTLKRVKQSSEISSSLSTHCNSQTNSIPSSETENKFRYLKKEEVKPGVIEFLENHPFTSSNYLGERCTKQDQSRFYKFKIPHISAQCILSNNFCFPDLQDYLRKREILSIICRRKQQRERRGKRNDEKTKKIFKRIMKSLLERFKKEYKKKHRKEISLVIEEKFYEHYFGNLEEDIHSFYDPLKKRFNNPHFKSISNDYLAQLKKSQPYVKDLLAFCQEEMIIQGMNKYTRNVLVKFSENPNFLQTLNKAKSKFEWVRFELKVAVMHFLFTFQNAVLKNRR
jgi:hypothetical protein